MLPANTLDDAFECLNVKTAALANRHPAHIVTCLFAGWHIGYDGIAGLKALYLLLAHQVATGKAVAAQGR